MPALMPSPCLTSCHPPRVASQAELEREFEEIKKQLEEDADREIGETKEKYEQK
jgi:hypothetical protein